MNKILFFTSAILILSFTQEQAHAQAPDWLWAKSAGGTDIESGKGIITDGSGNVYVTGSFNSPSITFGSTVLINEGFYDIFIVKYDNTGNVLWATSAGGASYDYSESISTDVNGNIYITGSFNSTSITFGTTTLTNVGNYDIFTVKYDNNGNVIWAKSAGGTHNDIGYSISTDGIGNILITGRFNSTSINFGPITLTNAGSADIFVVKYDNNGNVVWAKSGGGTSYDYCESIAADVYGNIYITGRFNSDSITFDSITLINAGLDDIYVVKYDNNGNVLWANSAGGADFDYGGSITADSIGNIYVTGHFFGTSITFGSTVLTNSGYADIFIVKYDNNGNVIWAKGAGGTDFDGTKSIATDGNGNVYVTGSFNSPYITFSSASLTNSGSHDMFIVKYDNNGNVLWVKSANGSSHDYGYSITTDGIGNLYVTGRFDNDPITFGSTTLTNAGSQDIFVAKLNSVTGIEEEIFSGSLDIFPNPFTLQTILQTDKLLNNASLTVENIFGQTVKQINNISGKTITLHRDNLPGGLYFVQLYESNKLIAVKKIVIGY